MIPSHEESSEYDIHHWGWFPQKMILQVSAMIGNIRNMSNDMNTALNRQNQTLDRINAKANSDITRVKMANERAAALMK